MPEGFPDRRSPEAHAEKEMKRLEYQKISEQKTGAEQELKKLQEEYRDSAGK